MLVERLCVVDHLILHGCGHKVRISLGALNGSLDRVPHVTGYSRLWGKNSAVFNHTAVLQNAPTALNTEVKVPSLC